MTGDKATVSVPSYNDELDIALGGKGAIKWSDQTVSLKDYAEFGKQLPLQNNKIMDDMVDLPYLHEVSAHMDWNHTLYSTWIILSHPFTHRSHCFHTLM
jgi:hypothetical protein